MNAAGRVMQSYERCCAGTGPFDGFYRHLLASSPQIRAKFAITDTTVQRHLLRAGIMNLATYAHGVPDSKLRALGASHSRATLDIRPELYDLWSDALPMVVVEHNCDCDAETHDAWRSVTDRSIAAIKSYY